MNIFDTVFMIIPNSFICIPNSHKQQKQDMNSRIKVIKCYICWVFSLVKSVLK